MRGKGLRHEREAQRQKRLENKDPPVAEKLLSNAYISPLMTEYLRY